MKSIKPLQKGSSLIEVLVALAVLAIGFSVVMKTIFAANEIFRTQYQGRLEVQLITNESEKIRILGAIQTLSDSSWNYNSEANEYFVEPKQNDIRFELAVLDSAKLESLSEEESWESMKHTSMMLRPKEAKLELFRYNQKAEDWEKRREMFFFIPSYRGKVEKLFKEDEVEFGY